MTPLDASPHPYGGGLRAVAHPLRSALAGALLIACVAWGGALAPSAFAQDDATMTVEERDEDGKAARITLDFVNAEVQQLLKFLQTETNLTIIATEEDVKDKKLSLLNLKDVTIEEAIEKIKSGLMQFGLTTIRTDSTIIITTIEKAVKMKVPVSTGASPESIPDTDQVITHVIPLVYLDADKLAGQIKPMTSDAAVVFGDQESNTLVITDVASNIRRVATLLQGMDSAQSTPLEIVVIQINNTDVEQIEDALEDLYGRARDNVRRIRDQGRSGSSQMHDDVFITSTEDTNQLIIQATAENIAAIREVIVKLDTAPSMQMEFKVFRLKFANAEDVVEDLEDILEGQSSNQRNRPWWDRGRRNQGGDTIQGIIGEIRIAADERLNGIIVGTDPRNLPVIQTLIDAIDQEDQPGEEIKIYFLENADATTLVANITELVEGQEEEDDTPWWFNRRQDDTPTEGTFGLRGLVNLTADTRLNAIVAATSSANLVVLDDLIKRLDVSMPDQEWGTRIYELKYGDSENVANILTSVYQGSSGGNQRGGFFSFLSRNNQRAQARGSLAGNVVAEAYPTINAVIVSTSTARNFEMIEEFVKQLDVPTPPEQREVTRVFNLEYSQAADLENLLNSLWEGDNQGGFNFGRAITRGFRPEQNDINSLSGKVRIFADPQTNSLVVTASQRYIPDVEALIRELDIVRGQVWIDITILELTLDDVTKLGIEMELTERRLFGADAFGKARKPGSNPLTGAFSADVGLGREASGFSLSLATQEYMVFLHTLMRRNQVRTLSRVPLYVRDNEEATFISGRDIPYIQTQQTSEFTGSQIFGFDFLQDIGINITITPHIARRSVTEGGKRTIGLDITQITASNFLEFTSFGAPLTEESTISTYIDAQDGQQIVIGGLKKTKRQEIEDKVPILGDLPLIGRFFKRTETVAQDSEVVIVITPHIVDMNDPADRVRLDTLQRERFGSEEEGVLDPPAAD
jgi:type II secretory pathway component GspD/PulD (secretin)